MLLILLYVYIFTSTCVMYTYTCTHTYTRRCCRAGLRAITLPSHSITAPYYLCSSYVYVFLYPYLADYILSDKITVLLRNRLLYIYYTHMVYCDVCIALASVEIVLAQKNNTVVGVLFLSRFLLFCIVLYYKHNTT